MRIRDFIKLTDNEEQGDEGKSNKVMINKSE